MFDIDSTGNLGVACLSSDLSLVSSANSNIALYWSSSVSIWVWAKQLNSLTGENLIDLKLRGTDSARMALLYQSSLVIVLNTVDGSVIESHSQSLMVCNLGCMLLYPSATLYLLGTYVESGNEYFGLIGFIPDSGVPTGSVSLYALSSYQLRHPVGLYTIDSPPRILLAATSTSPSYISMFFGMTSPFTSIDYIVAGFTNTQAMALTYTTYATNRNYFYLSDMVT